MTKFFEKRKGLKITAIILAAILLVWFLLFILPRPKAIADNRFLIDKGTRPLLIAHGGGNKEFPDNTLEAFYNAYSIDKNVMMETDVNMTKDGVIILSHDTTLSRKTNVNVNIIDINYTDLIAQQVDFGYSNNTSGGLWADTVDPGNLTRYTNYLGNTVTPKDVNYSAAIKDGILAAGAMPRHESKFLATTLEDLLRAFPNNSVNVEIKQSGETGILAFQRAIELLDRLEAEGLSCYNRVCFASFHDEVYKEMQKLQAEKKLIFSPEYNSMIKFVITMYLGLDIFYTDKASVMQVPMSQSGINIATKLFIRTAHKHNIAVHYWTINKEEDMRFLCEIGADGIMSDIPTLLKKVLDEMYPNK